MQIFPKLLLRIGGDTFENLETLTPPKTISLTNTLYHHHSLAEAAKNQLSDFLYNYIPTLSSTDDQNLLLNLRRDIYNDREVNDDDIAACKNLIPDDQKELLNQYFENRAQLEKIIESGEETYAEEIALLRKRFQEITGKELLKLGLLLSSQTLLNKVEKYNNTPPQDFKKREYHTEQSLLKYLTRIFAKTSPFSTFTHLGIGETHDVSTIKFEQGNTAFTSHICLNNYL